MGKGNLDMDIVYSDKDIIKIEEAKKKSDEMARYGIKYCTVGDNCYPRVLRKIANRPAVLYYKGNITILNERHNLAVIGGRRCSKKAEELAFMTGEYCAQYNINVINGLALGCDTAALKGALHNGGKCVAIMPSGLDNIYPQSNSELADDIVSHGGTVTGSVSSKTSYLINNDINSTSSKNQKAKSLNIPIISEEQYLQLIGEHNG